MFSHDVVIENKTTKKIILNLPEFFDKVSVLDILHLKAGELIEFEAMCYEQAAYTKLDLFCRSNGLEPIIDLYYTIDTK